MKGGIISAKTKNKFRKAIRNVVKGLSRKVLIYKQPIKQECSNCYFDKMTGRSTGKCKWTVEEAAQKQEAWEIANPGQLKYKWFKYGRCPVCRGDGYLETKRKAWIDCLVIWNPENRYGNELTYTPAGTEGSTLVQLKTDPKHMDVFKNAISIVVDGVVCKISRPPVLRGLGNQSVLTIAAFTTEKPKIDSGEILKEYT